MCNWAARPGARCAHNLGYWRSASWWGLGPGAHSHVGGVRWWNVLHPARYAEGVGVRRVARGGREVLTDEQRRMERIMLEIRLADGLRLDDEAAGGRRGRLAADGLLDPGALAGGRARLTLDGRLLADHVARTLVTAASARSPPPRRVTPRRSGGAARGAAAQQAGQSACGGGAARRAGGARAAGRGP